MEEKTKANLALLGANFLYGAGFSIAKTVMPSLITPYAFILLRVGISVILFWLLLLFSKKQAVIIDIKDWWRIFFCSVFGIAINQLLFFKGLSLTSPIHASLIMLSTPIFVTFIAAYLLNEKLKLIKLLGLILGIVGAIILVLFSKKSNLSTNPALGDTFIFLNAISYAIYLVIVKPLMQKYDAILIIRYVFTIGFMMVLPFGFNELKEVKWHLFSVNNYLAMAFIVVFVTFFTYLWNIFALKILRASTAGAYIFLQPLFAAIIAILFFAEEVTMVKTIAAILIFSGVYIVGNKKINLK